MHGLSEENLAKRKVVYIDIANDAIASSDYHPDRDPKTFVSAKTGRGPLDGPEWWKVRRPAPLLSLSFFVCVCNNR